MASVLLRSVLIVILTIYVFGDEIEMEIQSGTILKMLREMVNQTASETLNLPANSTSIRENITDTFSCDNRTYGYYADVDNDCQIFHVCLPSQTPSGRNITYRWSFICPQETVFNQEVLVCTRVADSIPCEESPDFYDLNMEIGKIAPIETDKEEKDTLKKEVESVPAKKDNRLPNRKKQNIIMEALKQEAEEMEKVIEELDAPMFNSEIGSVNQEVDSVVALESSQNFDEVEAPVIKPVINTDYSPVMNPIINAGIESATKTTVDVFDEDSRLGAERSLKRQGRNYRGSKRFKYDF